MGMTIPASRVRHIVATMALMLLAACSGGGSSAGSGSGSSGGSSSSSSGGVAPLSNFATVTVDAGPAALNVGPNGYTATNTPYVTITICAPGSTSNCQTIDHVLLDTGSVGLRLEASVLNAGLLSALTSQTDPAGNVVGECYQFVDNYVFGSVREGDFSIGGESVKSMPMQVIGDPAGTFATAPTSCSSTGGSNMDTPQLLGANGLIGVGTTTTDCGAICTVANSSSGSIYYDCPTAGCSTIIARAANTNAPFQQLPNPVAAFAVDNNGTIVSLPSVAQAGAATVTGTIYFGIGTQTNNGLGSASVLPTDQYGLITATYNGTSFPNSFIDSGSNYYYWVDNVITQCSQSGYVGFYCPSSALSLTPTLSGYGGGSASAAFTLYNAYNEFQTATGAAIPGVGGNPVTLKFPNPIPGSFDFGLPFFFGRNIYTAIKGRPAGGVVGPYFAY
jgi:hypothetical protein